MHGGGRLPRRSGIRHTLALLPLLVVQGCINPFAPKLDTSPAASSCDPTTLDGVFQCFQNAYTFRDSTAYGQLIDGSFLFVYRDYELGIDITWGRDEEMRVTYGLFQNAQKLDLIWNNYVTRTESDTAAVAVRGFNLTVTYNPSSIDRVDGYANVTFARGAAGDPWKMVLWRDESNY